MPPAEQLKGNSLPPPSPPRPPPTPTPPSREEKDSPSPSCLSCHRFSSPKDPRSHEGDAWRQPALQRNNFAQDTLPRGDPSHAAEAHAMSRV
ncbi:hypothetical protein cyc_03194 [Cyclospora cayetanensis]|uniref:Uncharacterized protein n=1 Tax=Cyclospora cayetanensis TaxID=88456 RepID=A0A1D3D9L1_9EIME|nr:hypothetical protein cyc_03194 [Cyclospora cayetanensis]